MNFALSTECSCDETSKTTTTGSISTPATTSGMKQKLFYFNLLRIKVNCLSFHSNQL